MIYTGDCLILAALAGHELKRKNNNKVVLKYRKKAVDSILALSREIQPGT